MKEAILHRMKLYKSLKRRGLMTEDAILNGVEGSLYDSMLSYMKNCDMMYEPTIGSLAENWFSVASMIYEDTSLTEPKGWREFLKSVKQISMYPETHRSYQYKIEQALETYAPELMAVDIPKHTEGVI